MEIINVLIRFIQDGGAFMYPIMVTLALGLAIAIERYLYLVTVKIQNKRAWEKIQPLMLQGKINRTLEYARNSSSHLSAMLMYALTHLMEGRRKEDVERMLEEGLMEIIPRLEKRTPYLATFANIATLLGLLGTILGLIAAFSAVANADPADKANMLSSSISVAMNTTAFGLIAAIPLLILHSVIATKTAEIIDSLDMATIKMSNLIKLNRNAREELVEEPETQSPVTFKS